MTDFLTKIQASAAGMESRMRQVVDKHVARLWRTLIDRMRGGTSANTLGRRTGELVSSTRPLPTISGGGRTTGGVVVGAPYAGVHIGPRGSTQTIKASKKFLTIPTDFAKTAAGVAKGRMQGPPWTFLGMPTFIAKGVIFGKLEGAHKSSEGARQRRAAGEKMSSGQIIPLFILKSEVKVPRRIRRRVISAKKRSTWFSQLALVGVKCK